MEKKYLIATLIVFVMAIFVVGLNIDNNEAIPEGVGDGLDYGSNVRVYLNDELVDSTENTVTTAGLNNVLSALAYGQSTLITNLTVGNTTAPAAGETALAGIYTTHGLAGETGTVNSNGDGNWSVAYTWTCTSGAVTVNTTALYNVTNAMFAGTTFTATTLQTDDQLKVNYTLWVS